MAFDETSGGGNGLYMPVAPAYGNNGGFGGGDGWWIILLLLACGGGWGGFGGGWGGYGNMALGYDFPWILNGQTNISGQMSDGFRDQMLNTTLNSIQNGVTSGFGDVQTALCGGFAGVNATVNGVGSTISQQLYTNQISDLERSFAAQTATTQGMNGIQAGIADLRYTEATEGCATRNNSTQNTQTIITAITSGIQSIKDQLYQDKMDAKNDEIAQLRQENLYARGQASQVAQNADIINGVYTRLSQCPVNTVPVFGNQAIFGCTSYVGNNGCGCGNASGFVG